MREAAVDALVFTDGSRTAIDPSDLVVSAVPWHAYGALDGAPPAGPGALASSPIVSVWFRMQSAADAPLRGEALVAFVDGDPFHFLVRRPGGEEVEGRSEEHTSELQSLTASSYAVFCLRSEERRVGKECSQQCRSRWSPYH